MEKSLTKQQSNIFESFRLSLATTEETMISTEKVRKICFTTIETVCPSSSSVGLLDDDHNLLKS